MPYVFSPEVRTGPEGEDVVWRGATPTEAVQTSPTCCRTASGWLMWGPAVTVGLVHLQTGTSSRVYCVTAGLSRLDVAAQCSSTLRSPTLPFTPRVSSAEPGRVWKYPTLWSLHFWRPAAARWQRSFVPVRVRLDLQSWMQRAQLLWRIPHLPPTSAFSHWRTSSSAYTLNNHPPPPKKRVCRFLKTKKEKNSNMSINNMQPFLLISLTSWIIHRQLELRGRSRPTAQVHFQWFIYWAKQGISKLLFTAHYPTACYFYAIVITPGSSRSAAEVKSIKGSWEPFSRHTPRSVSGSELGCTGTTNLTRSQVSRNEMLQVTQVGRYEAH